MRELQALKKEVADLKATLHTMGKHQVAQNRKQGIDYELRQQAPDMPQEIRQLARTALSGTEGDPQAAVSAFLGNEETKALIANHAAQGGAQTQQSAQTQQTSQAGKRPSMAQMLSDISSGKAKLKF